MSARLCTKWTGAESQIEAAERCGQWGPKEIACAEPECYRAVAGTKVVDVLKLAQQSGWTYVPTKADPHVEISKRYCPLHRHEDGIPFTDEFIDSFLDYEAPGMGGGTVRRLRKLWERAKKTFQGGDLNGNRNKTSGFC